MVQRTWMDLIRAKRSCLPFVRARFSISARTYETVRKGKFFVDISSRVSFGLKSERSSTLLAISLNVSRIRFSKSCKIQSSGLIARIQR
jgi:hypothetical protein